MGKALVRNFNENTLREKSPPSTKEKFAPEAFQLPVESVPGQVTGTIKHGGFIFAIAEGLGDEGVRDESLGLRTD